MEYVLTERRVHLPIFNKTSLLSKKKKKRFKGVRDVLRDYLAYKYYYCFCFFGLSGCNIILWLTKSITYLFVCLHLNIKKWLKNIRLIRARIHMVKELTVKKKKILKMSVLKSVPRTLENWESKYFKKKTCFKRKTWPLLRTDHWFDYFIQFSKISYYLTMFFFKSASPELSEEVYLKSDQRVWSFLKKTGCLYL